MGRIFSRVSLLFFLTALFLCSANCNAADRAFTLVVMDPLSKPLSCDCVQGYAQRDYKKLAVFLQKQLGRRVDVVWYESLVEALKETDGKADLIIGKHSVVAYDANKLEMPVEPIARLTGRDGTVSLDRSAVCADEEGKEQGRWCIEE